jgi:cytoskeletal protein RodZ
MTDMNSEAARDHAAMRAARLRRASMIRRRIVGGSVALFVAAWLLIAVVLVSGHDPALAKRSSASTVASSSTPSTSSTSSGSDTTSSGSDTTSSGSDTGSTSGTSSQSSSPSGSGSVSSVTTSQS